MSGAIRLITNPASILGGDKPKAPKPQRSAPTPDDAEVRRRRRRASAENKDRSGRQSTVLTSGDSDKKLGG